MEVNTFILFMAIVVFGFFSIYANMKSRDTILSRVTIWSLYLSIVAIWVLLAVSVYRLLIQ